ncbi:prolyl oligopeptidase family serine peptidase [Halobacillus locisalis]|uniref:Prolyl oligopeptidase family serine peptidase n=1 Tax=Halobacillus locisalis TaxID=220753 RepID=A0A838CQJ4_9BACI|nr:prolyl oligopeptidase family serine peptidase [Halobacillus locisalis]
MRKYIVFLELFIFLAACRSEATEPFILDQDEFELPESKYSKTTELHKLRYRSDGLKVTGYMVKPKDRNEDFPLLIYARGGNQDYGMMTEEFLSTYLSFWANKGYVVLTTQYRGVDGGEGKEEYGGADIQDVMNLTQVAKELDGINTDRAFLLGQSRGGMMTYLAMKEGIDVQAAASINGSSDLFATYEEREQGMKKMLNELVGPPSEEQAYEDRSATY